MRVVAKHIDVVCWFDKEGVHPTRFKFVDEDGNSSVIKIDKIITKETEKIAGNTMLIFNCQSIINGLQKQYQLKYEFSSLKWMLFKI